MPKGTREIREAGNCFGDNIRVSCQIGEVGSGMKTGGEKQGKRSHRRNKLRRNVCFCEREGLSTLAFYFSLN